MEECSVLIETTKSAEDKTSRWFNLPIDYKLYFAHIDVTMDVYNHVKVMIIKMKKCCKPRKIKVCKKISKN